MLIWAGIKREFMMLYITVLIVNWKLNVVFRLQAKVLKMVPIAYINAYVLKNRTESYSVTWRNTQGDSCKLKINHFRWRILAQISCDEVTASCDPAVSQPQVELLLRLSQHSVGLPQDDHEDNLTVRICALKAYFFSFFSFCCLTLCSHNQEKWINI